MSAQTEKLLNEILKGELYIVGEYRGSHVGRREFVDKRDGRSKGKVTCQHLIEVTGRNGIHPVKLFQPIPLTINNPDEVKILFQKGKRYAFPLLSLDRDKGRLSGLLDSNLETISV